MEDGSGADGEGESPEAILVLDHAVEQSNLPVPQIPAEVGYMGPGQGARFVTSMLGNSGITVEYMDGVIQEEDHVYEFARIVDDGHLLEALTITDMLEVHLLPMQRMLGFQVKLCGGKKWKVRVAAERIINHLTGGPPASLKIKIKGHNLSTSDRFRLSHVL